MEGLKMDNDTRGWIMCLVSAAACVAGSTIICVDLVVRLLPFRSQFNVQESDTFLACSLSLSFGVMVFSALNGMLPSAKRYLQKGGLSDQKGGLILVAFFVAGFFGIQIVSRFLHQYMPSHVVDCDHTHSEVEPNDGHAHHENGLEHHHHGPSCSRKELHNNRTDPSPVIEDAAPVSGQGAASESTPLLGRTGFGNFGTEGQSKGATGGSDDAPSWPPEARRAITNMDAAERRPSIVQVQKRVMSFVKDSKPNCDSGGPCYGFTDPCGQECRKHLGMWPGSARQPGAARPAKFVGATGEALPEIAGEGSNDAPSWTSQAQSSETEVGVDSTTRLECSHSSDLEAQNHQHHHHVHNNAFLTLGLQTCIAITLHKFPEGFITYATNHANPVLGLNVFTALFVHNITEGFALALPLYMALGSRTKAMLWASLLGGLSQPAGAAIAALWFHVAKRNQMTLNETVYGGLFATTAGIMVSVALELFVESLSLNHNRNLSIFFAFVGMVILGLSNAFVAGH